MAEKAVMSYEMGAAATARVGEYFERIGAHLRHRGQRESFATYAFGILADGDRKSIEPIAARAVGGDEVECERMHDRLLHFVREGSWSDRDVRRESARYVLDAMGKREPITTWIIDDTGMLKQGKHSPGVQRQYTGSAGKIANCQLAVSLSLATRTEQVPIDVELYLPQSWTSDRKRCLRARIPDSVEFKTKIELATAMIKRAVADHLPGEVVLADSFYGRSHAFRDAVRNCGLDYAVAVDADTRVYPLDSIDRRTAGPLEAKALGLQWGERAFRKITWRDGTQRSYKLSSRFCIRRVKPAFDDGSEPTSREPIWLVVEWPSNEKEPTKFFLTSLKRRQSKKSIVRTIMERWKTERVYQELKGELGFDHFEGRSFTGWHHHVSAVLCCYAFVVAERVRAFPPSARGPGLTDTIAFAA